MARSPDERKNPPLMGSVSFRLHECSGVSGRDKHGPPSARWRARDLGSQTWNPPPAPLIVGPKPEDYVLTKVSQE